MALVARLVDLRGVYPVEPDPSPVKGEGVTVHHPHVAADDRNVLCPSDGGHEGQDDEEQYDEDQNRKDLNDVSHHIFLSCTNHIT